MSKLYKFIDENNIIEWDKNYVILNDKQISYPSEEILREAGIKPLIEDDIPEHDEINQYILEYYEETDTCIIKHWKILDIPLIEEVVEDEQITID